MSVGKTENAKNTADLPRSLGPRSCSGSLQRWRFQRNLTIWRHAQRVLWNANRTGAGPPDVRRKKWHLLCGFTRKARRIGVLCPPKKNAPAMVLRQRESLPVLTRFHRNQSGLSSCDRLHARRQARVCRCQPIDARMPAPASAAMYVEPFTHTCAVFSRSRVSSSSYTSARARARQLAPFCLRSGRLRWLRQAHICRLTSG